MTLVSAAVIMAALALVGCGGGSSNHANRTPSTSVTTTVTTPGPASLTKAGGPRSISFWDANRGIAGAGRCGHGHCIGTVLLTHDGGRTFDRALTVGQPVVWVDTADTEDAWATTEGQGPSRLLHSADGGKTWSRLPRSNAVDVSFASRSDGLAIGSQRSFTGGPLLRTSDGGRTWRGLGSPCPDPASGPVGIAQTSGASWVACIGQPGAGHQPKAVYKAPETGQRWQQLLSVALPGSGETESGGIPSYGYPEGIAFSAQGTGILWESRGTTYLTHDGGRSWVGLPQITKPEANFGASAAVVDSHSAFLLQTGGLRRSSIELLSTRDGGSTWGRVHAWRGRPGY
jgi:photosystem II stability/assembly factor-like uncharacterized protein